MTLPTTEQLEQKFNEMAHTNIDNERVWFWCGVATYCKILNEEAKKDYEQFKNENL